MPEDKKPVISNERASRFVAQPGDYIITSPAGTKTDKPDASEPLPPKSVHPPSGKKK